MPWDEYTVTLEDVAYQLGLPIDGEPVNGCLWDFEALMPEGTRRSRWEWFQEMFGELPEIPDRDSCTVMFSWFKSRFRKLSDDACDELVVRHAGAYIMMLLSLCRAANKNVVQVAGPLDLLQSWTFWQFLMLRPYGFDDVQWPLASRWGRYLPTSDEKGPRLLAHRKQLDLMPFREFVYLPYRTDAVETVLN
ncbi:hypothetical protein PIB30_053066 [Stylosanthes scabra]|uniref:Aminotransferase-like plant mobile domain-containing protein n=1 Tax=Stylosanthes scabra TaxID=79078 RepID=A0ABU6WKE1_9FABA|nr:hypothetical protein [Stylosanthes scabra]